MLLQIKNVEEKSWDHLSAFMQELTQKLIHGESAEALIAFARAKEGIRGVASFYYYLDQLQNRGSLLYSAGDKTAPLATLVPMRSGFPFNEKLSLDRRYTLSRFCFIRREKEDLIIESPLSPAYVIMHRQEAHLLFRELRKGTTFSELCEQFSNFPSKSIQDYLILLNNLNAISLLGEEESLEQWEFHDLLFHSRNRIGRHDYPLGGCYPFRETAHPLPVTKTWPSFQPILLYRPDLEVTKKQDPSFTEVLEKRCSVRSPSKALLNAELLGEFLYRTARIKQHMPTSIMDCSQRPSPAGGAIHELEIYAVIHQCEGLTSGIYHYDPDLHALHQVTGKNPRMDRLLEDVRASTMKEEFPQVLFVFTSRFQRLSWKYRAVSYALTLKNVGALMQTMYLVATAMSLSPCAVGSGNSDLFSELIGSDYYEETSVGEFILS